MLLGDITEDLVRLEVVAARLRVDALEVLPVMDDVRASGARAHQLRLIHVHALLVVGRHRHRLARHGVVHHLLYLSRAGRLLALQIVGTAVHGIDLHLSDHLRTYICIVNLIADVIGGLAL